MTTYHSPLKHPEGVQTPRGLELPDWEIAYRRLSPKKKAIWDARNELGLAPVVASPAGPLSEVYRNKKAGALDLARNIRHGTHDGKIIFDFWMSIMDGTNPRFNFEETDADGVVKKYRIPIEASLEASRLMATHGYPRLGPVNEKGETEGDAMGRTLYDLLQAARKREMRISVEGETRELPAGESQDDPST